MNDLIKALRESLKREQDRDEALRKHIESGAYDWGYRGYEFDKACDEAEDRLRKVLEEFVDARLGEILAAARQREERTEQEARQEASVSEPLQTVRIRINGQLCKAEEVEVVLPPEDDVRC